MYAPLDLRLVTNSLQSSPYIRIPRSRNPAKPQPRHRIEVVEEFIMENKDAVSVLEDLIETCKDGQKGYQDAAEHVKRTDLKTYFNQQSLERGQFAGELQSELTRVGKDKDKKPSGTVAGAMHRAWIDTKVALGGGDKSILNSIEAGEDTAKEAYQKALSGTLPSDIGEIIRRQASSVQKAHDHVKMLRDSAAAA